METRALGLLAAICKCFVDVVGHLLALERLSVVHGVQVISSPDEKIDMDTFSASGHLRTTALPLAKIGHKNSDLSAKYEAVLGSLKLDAALILVNTCSLVLP